MTTCVASAANAEPGKTATFAKDVAPIFQEKCEACHRPNSVAPFSLISYEDARPRARSIKSAVAKRIMPPWDIDRTVGIQHFKGDRSLSSSQIDTIVSWVDAGAPLGDAKDLPAPLKWPAEEVWNFSELYGQPDLVIKSPAYTQKAQAQDAWYKPVVETGLTEPRWVRAIEIRPSTVKGRRITHHALARLYQDEGEKTNPEEDAGPGLFMEWAVGKQGEVMRPNSGKLMLPGSKIVWDIHYHSVGEDITDQVELGIYLYPKGQEPKNRQVLALFNAFSGGASRLDIPPNTIAVHQGFHVMKQAGRVENFQPHMHLRGKAMSMEAILPNGTTQMLSYVGNFRFNWMTNYIYEDDDAPILPKGTILRITSWHDNTTANKDNPDPTQWVGWGDRTVDEMAHAWVNITYMNEDEYKAEVEKRKAAEAAKSSTTAQQPPQ
ncbi:MAG: hypothetical protein U0Q12_21575 [Vicinamibacterales bacterium]